ncbi:MAG: carboxypeptidase regulatory-like domain-containing protein [Bryobacterales bacterium]|nr:carboxypeptidase regulatory-like domain-containing protein [Bryobacterales bacterium]
MKIASFIAFLLLGIWMPSVNAQVLYGSVVGTVVDPSNAVVPGAEISITSKTTGATRETRTDTGGRYSLVNVLPGAYDLKVTAGGFRTATSENVTVTINVVSRVDVTLEVGSMTEQVTVISASALLQTDKSDVRTELNSQEITRLPLSNYRNFQSLLNLVPGATPTNFQHLGDAIGRALGTNVNGTAMNNNRTRVDGATNVFVWLPQHLVYVPPVESIETVNVTTSSFDAEQGMAGGSAMTVATKSGTNELHGVAYEYHDNQHLYTRNFFLPANQRIAKSIFNIFGGTIGGPIIKEKLFFFGSVEATRERAGSSPTPFSVPTQAIRAGNFSGLAATIFDPASAGPNGVGRTPFAGNLIPAGRMNPVSLRIQDKAPLPNLAGGSQGTLNNYYNSATERLDRENYDLKINWNPMQTLVVWGKYSRMDGYWEAPFALGEVGGPGLSKAGSPGINEMDVRIYTFGGTWTLSPTSVVDATFAMTPFKQTRYTSDIGTNVGSETWGIPNTNYPVVSGFAQGTEQVKKACPPSANGNCYTGMPAIVHGFTSWGNTFGYLPMWRDEGSKTFTTNITKVHGAHELRWGFDMVRYKMDHWQPETGAGPRGSLGFSANVTGAPGYTASSHLNSYATFLLGLTTSLAKTVQFFEMTNREWQFGYYFRDRWQVSRRLTLNLGFRHEYYPLISRRDRGIERWDPDTNLVYLGGIGGNPKNVGITTSKKLIAPRIGFAYRLNDSTVIRSGYGITFDPLPFSRPLRGLYPATIASSWVSSGPYAWIDTLDKGIPAVPLPDISTGVLTLPSSVDMGPRSPWPGELHRGYVQSWNFTVERKLPLDFVTSVAYVGTQTVRQMADRDINAAAPGTGPAGRPLAATQNRRIGANMWDGWVNGNYHSLQTAINREFSKGLFLKGAYTWSKTINWADEDGWAGMPLSNWTPTLRRNRATAGYDRTHMFTLGFLYDLPFGPGKAWVHSGVGSWLLRGWQTNGMYNIYTGTPFTISADGASLNAPGSSQTADQVKPGKVKVIGEIGANRPWFDPLAFAQPKGVRFGTTGRNTMRGPGMWNMDLSLFRTFALNERFKLEFKAEGFNITNTPKFANPGANVANMRLNTDGSIQTLNNFSSITGTLTALTSPSERKFRFGLRLSF